MYMIQVAQRKRVRKLIGKARKLPGSIKQAILDYEASYHRGVEKYGVWWKIFNYSMWAFILIFAGTAAIFFVFYLPKLQMLYGR